MLDRFPDHALARWGDALRSARLRRQRLLRRALAVAALGVGLAATLVFPPRPRLLWNASASAPVGLYAVRGRGDIDVGDLVLARPPAAWRSLAGVRRYVPVNVPLVKRVAALPGDRVCGQGPVVTVNGHRVAARRLADGQGRPMPWWHGCVTLRSGAMLLLMDAPDSFDGRYFGPTSPVDLAGELVPLWMWTERAP